MAPDLIRLPASERHRQAWKNGGGVTTEVYVFPAGSSIDEFEWRISIAEVASAGPFSHFPGVDRVLTVLEGELELRFEGDRAARMLTADSGPLRFSGEASCDGRPRNGTVRDLNIMVRRDTWTVEVEQIRFNDRPHSLQCAPSEGCAVLVAINGCEVTTRDAVVSLGPLDALLLPHDAPSANLQGMPDGTAVLGRFRRLRA